MLTYPFLASLFVEAGVVGVVCFVFLCLMVIAGIKQMKKRDEE